MRMSLHADSRLIQGLPSSTWNQYLSRSRAEHLSCNNLGILPEASGTCLRTLTLYTWLYRRAQAVTGWTFLTHVCAIVRSNPSETTNPIRGRDSKHFRGDNSSQSQRQIGNRRTPQRVSSGGTMTSRQYRTYHKATRQHCRYFSLMSPIPNLFTKATAYVPFPLRSSHFFV
jgi:hypothetical protein